MTDAVREIKDDDEARQVARILQEREDIPADVREGMTRSLRRYGPPGSGSTQHPRTDGSDLNIDPMSALQNLSGRGPGDNPFTAEGVGKTSQVAVDLVGGVIDVPFKIYELGLLTADAVVNDLDNPGLTASINKRHQEIDQLNTQKDSVQEGIKQQIWADSQTDPFWGGIVAETALLWPLNFAKHGTTFTRAMLGNTSAGAIFGTLAAVDGADQLSDVYADAAFGALLGAGVTIGLSSLKGIRAWVARQWVKESDTVLARDALKLEKQIQGRQLLERDREIRRAIDTGRKPPAPLKDDEMFSFSLAQIATDNPWLVSAEIGAGGRLLLQKQNKNLQTLVDFIETRSKDASGKALSPSKVVTDLAESMKKATIQMRGLAQRNYGRSIDAILDASDDSLVIDGRRYLTALREMGRNISDTFKLGGGDAPAGFVSHLNLMDEIIEPTAVRETADGLWQVYYKADGSVIRTTGNFKEATRVSERMIADTGGLTGEELRRVLVGHQELLADASTSSFFTNATGMQASVKYVNAELQNSLRGLDDATVVALTRARLAYKTDMTRIATLKNSSLGRILGQTDEQIQQSLADPNGVLDRLIELHDPAAMKATRDVLETIAPELIADLRSVVMRRILEATKKGSGARSHATIQENLNRFGIALEGAGNPSVTGKVGMGLFTPGQQQELIRTGNALKTLSATYIQRVGSDFAGMAADTAINLVSQSHEFMTRYLVRVLSKSQTLEHLLIDPKARQALVILAERGPQLKVGQTVAATNITEAATRKDPTNDPEFSAAVAYLTVAAGAAEAQQRKQSMDEATEILGRRQ